MTILTKALLGTGAAAAALVSTASPALARDRDRDGIDAGDIIAGAVVIGGIAALASAIGDDRYDGRNYDRRYDYRSGNPRQAVEQCVYTAERQASRRYRRADVTDIREVDRNRRGYTVRGRIAVDSGGRGWRQGDSLYGRGWNNDYRGWNNNLRGYDSGSFKCKVEYGRVVGLDFNNVRGL